MAYDIGAINLMLPTYGFGGFQSTGQGISDWARRRLISSDGQE